jgi:prepilin-type processing-associated H-X9-DG protein
MRAISSRRGFTLFQLLVILAILGILLGLLLPAVAKVREAAARTQSQNNLKQLGLAAHNYLSAYNKFPPGNDANNFSATAYLLPFVEQDNLFKKIDFTKPMDDKANAEARRAVVKIFVSPLDPVPAVDPAYGPTNYLFCAGSKPALADNDGVMYQDSKVKISDIVDGTSNTLLTGETLKGAKAAGGAPPDVRRQYVRLKEDDLKGVSDDTGVDFFKAGKNLAGDRCASWMDGRFLQGTFTGTRQANDARPDVSCGGAGGLSGLRAMGSQVNVGMCDGSVRVVSQAVKPDVWKLLASRNDGMAIPDY